MYFLVVFIFPHIFLKKKEKKKQQGKLRTIASQEEIDKYLNLCYSVIGDCRQLNCIVGRCLIIIL